LNDAANEEAHQHFDWLHEKVDDEK